MSISSGAGRGVLVTLKRDGRPQLSNVDYAFDGQVIRFSTTADRAKVRNMRRDPRVSFYVSTADGSAYTVAEGIRNGVGSGSHSRRCHRRGTHRCLSRGPGRAS